MELNLIQIRSRKYFLTCLQIVRESFILEYEGLRREMSTISLEKNFPCVTFYCMGALVYNKNFDRFTNIVGVTDQID